MKKTSLTALLMTLAFFAITSAYAQDRSRLQLSGQMYIYAGTDSNGALMYAQAEGSAAPIATPEWDGVVGTGSITDGKVSMTITATPTKLWPFNQESWLFKTPYLLPYPDGHMKPFGLSGYGPPGPYDIVVLYNNLNFSASGVEYASFSSLYFGTDDNDSREIVRENFSGTLTNLTSEEVTYIYVNKDVTVTGSGKTTTLTSSSNWNMGTATVTTRNINLSLKRGWNAVYTKTVKQEQQNGSVTLTIEMSIGDPTQMKWIFYRYRGNN